jgi:hypothetical protein
VAWRIDPHHRRAPNGGIAIGFDADLPHGGIDPALDLGRACANDERRPADAAAGE